jgi:hypothetical protein
MQTINSEASLRSAILQLEIKQAEEGRILKEKFLVAYESVKPVNMILGALKEIVANHDLKEDLITTSASLAAGYLSKMAIRGVTKNPLKRLIGSALISGITNVAASNPETIKSLLKGLMKIFRSRPVNRVRAE